MEEEQNDLVEFYRIMRPRNICICKAVSENDIIKAIQEGYNTYEKVVLRTGATTGCGTCFRSVFNIVKREKDGI